MHITNSGSYVGTLKPTVKVSVTKDGGEHQSSVWNSLGVINEGYTKRCVQIYPVEVFKNIPTLLFNYLLRYSVHLLFYRC